MKLQSVACDFIDGIALPRGIALPGADASPGGTAYDGLSSGLLQRFVQTCLDERGQAFARARLGSRHGRLKTAAHDFLRQFISDYDCNGWLDMYPMHLLSREQWCQLLPSKGGRLLDVGSGNGDLLAELAEHFDEVTTTEHSVAMRWRLRKLGHAPTRDLPEAGYFDCISCLNVLDRTETPLTLLRELRSRVAQGGCLILAVPLPIDPFYYRGPQTKVPAESLGTSAKHWESAVCELHGALLAELPEFGLYSWTRAPYLSGGDAGQALYALDDAVIVLQRAREPHPESSQRS